VNKPGVIVNGRRWYGHIPDADHRKPKRDVREFLALARGGALPQTFSLRSFAPATYNQGQTGSCTGHAGAQGTATARAASGLALPFRPSPKRIYAPVRALERVANDDGTLPALTDSGGQIADICTVVSQIGVCPMAPSQSPDGRISDVWSVADTGGTGPDEGGNAQTDVNEEPEVIDLAAGSGALIVGEYGLDPSSSSLGPTIQQALYTTKAPLVIGVVVGSEVQDFTASSAPVGPTPAGDPEAGGHAIVVDGYVLMPDGSTAYNVHNSWGASYGLGGGFLATLAFLQSCSDMYAWTVRKAA
jgi:hypothetical protein